MQILVVGISLRIKAKHLIFNKKKELFIEGGKVQFSEFIGTYLIPWVQLSVVLVRLGL